MDIKEFIKTTINSIVDASLELQKELEATGCEINSPITHTERHLVDFNTETGGFRRVQEVEFDLAVTTSQETSGGGAGKLRILDSEIGGQAEHNRSNETASRVSFSIPISLPPGDSYSKIIEKNGVAKPKSKRRLLATRSHRWLNIKSKNSPDTHRVSGVKYQ